VKTAGAIWRRAAASVLVARSLALFEDIGANGTGLRHSRARCWSRLGRARLLQHGRGCDMLARDNDNDNGTDISNDADDAHRHNAAQSTVVGWGADGFPGTALGSRAQKWEGLLHPGGPGPTSQ